MEHELGYLDLGRVFGEGYGGVSNPEDKEMRSVMFCLWCCCCELC